MKRQSGNCAVWIFVLRAFFLCILSPVFLHAQDESGPERVARALREMPGKSFSIDERALLADYGGFESSLLVRAQNPAGERPAGPEGTFILAVPFDAAFAVDTALAAAEKMKDNGVNVLVAFLGGEKNTLPGDMDGVSHKGLRDLLTLTDLPENRVICYLDADRVPEELILSHGSMGYLAPLKIIDPLPSLFASYGIPWAFEISYNSFYTLGLAEGREALSIIRQEEVNGFVLSGAETGSANQNKTGMAEADGQKISPQDLADLLLNYAAALQFPVINPDRNYTFFAFPGGKIFFASERIMVILLLVTVGAFLFFYLLYSVQHNAVLFFYLRRFVKSIWIFLSLFLLLMISIKISGAAYSLLIGIFHKPDSVSYASFILVLLLSLLLFLLCGNRIRKRIPFRFRERFYGFSSVMFIILGMFFAAFIDISVIPIFIWAFAFVILGTFLSSAIAIFLCSLSIPVFALFAVSSIFKTSAGAAVDSAGTVVGGGGRIAELFIFSGWNAPDAWVIIFLTVILVLPSLLLLMRGAVFARIKLKRNPLPIVWRKNRRAYLLTMAAAVILAMVIQIWIPTRQVSYERRYITETTEAESVFTLALDGVIFQNSRIVTVTLAAKGNPKRFNLSIAAITAETEQNLPPVYASPVPFERESEGRTIRFVLGENPPNPLNVEIVFPVEFDGVVNASAIYDEWDPLVDRDEKPVSEKYILEVSRSADLKSRENYQLNSTLIPSADESTP